MIKDYPEIMELLRSLWPARLFMSYVELGIPQALGHDALTVEELARRTSTDERALGIALHALVGLGMTEKRNQHWINSELARKLLLEDSPDYKGSSFRHQLDLFNSWSRLTDILRTGRRGQKEKKRSPENYRDFIGAMYDYSRQHARSVAERIDLEGLETLLDLGGGPGSYAIAFCAQHPALKAVVYDRAQAIDIARQKVAAHMLRDRIDFIEADFLSDPIPGKYDCIWISHVLHSYDESSNDLLLNKAVAALNPDGRLYIQEFFLENNKTEPAQSALFAVNMLVNTTAGRTYTYAEVIDQMKAAGLSETKREFIEEGAGIVSGINRV